MASVFKRKADRNDPNSRWTAKIRVAPGVYKPVIGFTDKRATEKYARRLEDEFRAMERGERDAAAEKLGTQARRPIGQHVAEYRAFLESKRNSTQHVDETIGGIEATIETCGWLTLTDLDGARFAALLGELVTAGKSARTANKRRLAVRGFVRWLVREARLRVDPLANVGPMREEDDVRRDRRALSDEELMRMIRAAEGGATIGGLSGRDRAMLYRVAVGTGFRVAELASLTPASFDLDADGGPWVVVGAGYSKRRRRDVQPIRPDLAEVLRPWLRGRDTEARLWRTSKRHTAGMVATDLEAARAKWLNEAADERERTQRDKSDTLRMVDSAGRVADFHALRHTFITRMLRARVSPKTMQSLARHSTITLTMDRYSHLDLADPAAALDSLPSLEIAPDEAVMLATGTEGAHQMAHQSPVPTGPMRGSAGRMAGLAPRSRRSAKASGITGFGTSGVIRATLLPNTCRSGGMADAPDSKSGSP